ncbi:1581_t:CDS:1, partial [Funneliformis mosseae]
MTSEIPASPSEIHADDTEVFQLKALSLNFLRNTSEITDEHIPKLNPCHFCDEGILALPLHSFTVLSYGHIYHRICLKKHIVRSETRSPLCPIPSCISPIELVNEELILASGEYHMVSKDKDFRKKGPLSDDTVGGESELLHDLGLIDDDSLANQGEKIIKTITHDQTTSLTIDVESSTDNLTNQTAGDNTDNAQIRSSRESSPKISHE